MSEISQSVLKRGSEKNGRGKKANLDCCCSEVAGAAEDDDGGQVSDVDDDDGVKVVLRGERFAC